MLKHTKISDPFVYQQLSEELRRQEENIENGKQFQTALHKVGTSVNTILVSYDTQPAVTSGVPIGLTCVTQRGMKESEIVEIDEIMKLVAYHVGNEEELFLSKEKASQLIRNFHFIKKIFLRIDL